MNEEEKAAKKAAKQAKKKEKGHVPFGKLVAWSLRSGSTGVCMMIIGYLSIFCTDTLGVPAASVGVLLLASKFLDGITDLFAGYIVDRTNTKWGKGRPYEWCVVGMWISTLLLYMTPAQFSTPAKLVWIFIMYALANSVFYTFLNANATVYMVRAFNGQKEYVELSSYGGLITMLLVVVFNVLFPIAMGTLATSQRGWIQLVLIFMIPMVILGMMRFFVVKEVNNVDVEAHGEKVSFKDVFKVLGNNPYIYIIAIGTLVLNIITNMGVNVYYFTHIVGNVSLMSVLAITQVVALPLMFVLPTILNKTTVVNVIKVGILVTITGYMINFFAGSNLALLVIGNILTGAGVVPLSMLGGLLIIECADYNEYKGMRRLEGSLSSVNGFASKVGAGVGSGLLGILIGAAGYDGTLSVQPTSALTMIRGLYSWIPAAMYVVVFIAFSLYRLGKKIPEIRKVNEERRAEIVEKQEETEKAAEQ